MKALRISVERIVRPLHASELRKDRIREELLSHITAAFDEERAAGFAEPEAAARAAQRLREPPTVTRRLQASIPKSERIMFYPLPYSQALRRFVWTRIQPRAGESALVWSVRISSFIFAIPMAVMMFLVIPLMKASRWNGADSWVHFGFAVPIWLIVSAGIFMFYFVLESFGRSHIRSTPPRKRLPVILCAGVMGSLPLCSGLLFAWICRDRLEFTSGYLAYLTIASVATAVLAPIIGAAHAADAQRWRDWGILDLSERG